jgi:hypothetical protein
MADEKIDRRDVLEAAMEAAENDSPALEREETSEVDHAQESSEIETSEANHEESTKVSAQSESEDAYEEQEATEETKSVSRPSTWKKEYVQIWDKMEKGEQISKEDFTKFAEYANQRESEYKKGVSTYKQEADYAKGMIDAITPYVPALQQKNIEPAHYIASLAKADQILTNAPYEQKVQLFHQLAHAYGIQLNNQGQAQQIDPLNRQLMSQLQMMNKEVSTIKSRFQQEEETRLNQEIERVRSNVEQFPHFDLVREDMARLLERGDAQTLESAYAKAVRLNDDVWSKEQERLLNSANKQASKAQQVAKAKAAAVSPRSVTPNGQVASGDKKDRRSLIAEQLGSALNGRV